MKKTFTDILRVAFKWILDPVGGFLNRIGLTPNTVTLLGVVGNIVAAYFIIRGQVVTGGIIMLIVWPVDALDGTMARLRGEASDWGAFVDSVSDRYSELILLGGLLYHFAITNQHVGEIVTFAAAAGSILVGSAAAIVVAGAAVGMPAGRRGVQAASKISRLGSRRAAWNTTPREVKIGNKVLNSNLRGGYRRSYLQAAP